MTTTRSLSFLLALGILAPATARAQLVQEFQPPKADCCLQFSAQRLADELQDWNQLGRYYADDARLVAAGAVKGRVVFMGDSITDGWDLAKYFPGKPYVNRGISGQTTPQMLVRMYPDVIRLEPSAIIILAGTNDVARNTGPETLQMIEDNFRGMCELAARHNIKVVLCLLTPVSDYTKSKQTPHRPPADIIQLNGWLRSYAAEIHAQVADYYSALVDSRGMLKEGSSDDGLHPNARGYELMAPVAEVALEKALQ
ncbi:MAG: SGNH/GDSL hydrolase family protein [Acidobacteriia bacterium]|nr:SGNH/GDSL hydrolase family protein [Terriglobia bacterium]